MSYNNNELPQFMQTAGKITILTALVGVMVFVVAFLFDAGTKQLNRVSAAGTASTTLTVLNTPPAFVINARELIDSTTTTPTNSGSNITWTARAVDSNSAPYFLLVCKTNASPTASVGTGVGTVAPACGGGTSNLWAVSTGTVSGVSRIISTTTTEAFVETNPWYAWVCDDAAINPRCTTLSVQGPTSTTAFTSPFNVNHRPVFTSYTNNGPKDPGQVVTFSSVSTDPDVVGGADTVYLIVCNNNGGINPVTRLCNSGGIASTSGTVTTNATALYTLASIVQDQAYASFGFLVDNHGHTASANSRSQSFTVNNVAPAVLSGDITLNNGSNITLTNPGNETTGFALSFKVRDNNSCRNAASGNEIASYRVALHRSSFATSTCTGLSGSYNPNSCYASGVPSTVWNLSCTASSTSCTGATDIDIIYNCTFPLWFVADPTDAGPNTPAAFAADTWKAAVLGTDDNGLSSSLVDGSSPVELISFTALDLLTAQIPYGSLEPGANSGTLSASTTVRSVGNTGLDEQLSGDSMCGTYAVANKCKPSATSTVAESNQKFSTTSLSYGSSFATTLSSTTIKELEINIAKSTSTTSPQKKATYWGIGVPISITLAGNYKGLNTFIAKTAEAIDW